MFPSVLASAAMFLGASLVVETTSPDALCPDLGSARQAVADRLGALEVDAEGWVASYVVVRTPGGRGDHLRLELKDPEQKLQLSREIPLEPGTCPAMAAAIALVLERFFADLTAVDAEEASRSAESPSAGPEESTPTEAFAPLQSDPPPPPIEPAAPAPNPVVVEPGRPASSRARWQLRLGPAFGVAASEEGSDLRPAVGLAARAMGPRHLEIGVLGTARLGVREETVELGGGDVECRARAQTIRLFSRYWFGDDGWRLSVGPEVVLGLEWASAEPSEREGTQGRALPGFGAGSAFTVRLGRVVSLGLAASLDWIAADGVRGFTYSWTPPGADELTREVLLPRRMNGFLGAALEFAPGE